MAQTHYFPEDRVHFTWDTGHESVLEIDSGDTVVVVTRDVSDDQIGPGSTTDVIAGLDWDRVYPLAGPIWSSLTSRVTTTTVSPLSISSTDSCPVSHVKCTRSSGK